MDSQARNQVLRHSRGTRHNRRVRGGGTWGEQGRRLYGHQEERYRREMGRGSWTERGRRLYREGHRRDRSRRNPPRRTARRNYGRAVVVGALILGAVLLMSPSTRGTGLTVLVLVGVVLYVIIGRKKA